MFVDSLEVTNSTQRNSRSRGFSCTAAPLVAAVAAGALVLGGRYGAYTSYKSGDPVDFIANAILGCAPGGAAAKPAVVKLIRANKGAIVKALKGLGISGPLIAALEGDRAD